MADENSQNYLEKSTRNSTPECCRQVYPKFSEVFLEIRIFFSKTTYFSASIHTSRYTRQFFHLNNVPRTTWPAQSPDLNIIENVWKHFKEQILKIIGSIRNNDDLFEKFSEIFFNYPHEKIENLYDSLPRRLKEVIAMKGHLTKY